MSARFLLSALAAACCSCQSLPAQVGKNSTKRREVIITGGQSVTIQAGGSITTQGAPDPVEAPDPKEQALLHGLAKQAVTLDLYHASAGPTYAVFTKSMDQIARQQGASGSRRRALDAIKQAANANPNNTPHRTVRQEVITPTGVMKSIRILPPLPVVKSRYENAPKPLHPLAVWLKNRPDLQGLPLTVNDSARLDFEPAENLRQNSSAFLAFRLFPHSGEALILEYLKKTAWTAEDIPSLTQILQASTRKVRLKYVEILAGIPDQAASEALVSRALFDTSAEVRERAIAALGSRNSSDVEDQIVEGFSHPWRAVAEHAADALIALGRTSTAAKLKKFQNQLDPAAPFQKPNGRWVQRELVRVNHLRNCLLCHAPSTDSKDLVRGVVPDPGQPLPREYYRAKSGYFARADVTYLRQDFSAVHHVKGAGRWPENQRFDYFVRETPLSEPAAKKRLANWDDAAYRKALARAITKLQQ